MGEDELVSLGFSALQLDQALVAVILNHLRSVVCGIIEETLNAYLDSEADRICGAHRYERTGTRKDRRDGVCRRTLSTIFGTLKLRIPKLRNSKLPVEVIGRLESQQKLIERSLVEMYLTHASDESIEAVAAALLGSAARPSQRMNFSYKIRAKLDAWQHQYIQHSPRNVHLDVIDIHRLGGIGTPNAKLFMASSINADGKREMLAIHESSMDSETATPEFLRNLKARGLTISQTQKTHGRQKMHA